jgi:hypothetical protein
MKPGSLLATLPSDEPEVSFPNACALQRRRSTGGSAASLSQANLRSNIRSEPVNPPTTNRRSPVLAISGKLKSEEPILKPRQSVISNCLAELMQLFSVCAPMRSYASDGWSRVGLASHHELKRIGKATLGLKLRSIKPITPRSSAADHRFLTRASEASRP